MNKSYIHKTQTIGFFLKDHVKCVFFQMNSMKIIFSFTIFHKFFQYVTAAIMRVIHYILKNFIYYLLLLFLRILFKKAI